MKIYLAPMEGVIDHHMRSLLSNIGGLDLCVTEFVRITDHTLPERVFKRYCPELLRNIDIPVRVQLLGSNPDALARNAAKVARMGAPGVDLNFGCPAKTVNQNKGGACLLDDTHLIAEIVGKVREAVQGNTPVTAKIRLGYESRDSYLKNARAIESAGADELIVHARSKADGYRPPAYWEYIEEIRQAINIPVVANGEIWTLDDFDRCRKITGCEHFMLGRGALARPDLAVQIKSRLENIQHAPYTWKEVAPLVLSYFEDTASSYPEKYMGNRLKQWLYYLQMAHEEAVELFNSIKRERDFTIIKKKIIESMR